ncbi:putative transcriptional regulator [Rhodococcus rhodnii LMG 5362]|nr:putative transcriptional regulator [Rhodococcus rhodnii LMG 5362]
MVPYFLAHPGISAETAAAEFGVSVDQLMTDLNQLWVCGLPGYGPGDLIDLSFSEESIEVTFSAGMDRPLRLTSREATALLVALRSLVELPGTVDPTAAQRAIAKIEDAVGAAAASRASLPVTARATENPPAENPTTAIVRGALTAGHALALTYYSASRDTVTERTVDPIRIVVVDNTSYLQAWCRSALGVRLFRFDRIDAARELDEPSAPPETAREAGESLDLFGDHSAVPRATLRLAPGNTWMLDYYPMDPVATGEDGSLTVTMPYANADWMTRFVLGCGATIGVISPADLAASVRAAATAALEFYDAAPGDGGGAAR